MRTGPLLALPACTLGGGASPPGTSYPSSECSTVKTTAGSSELVLGGHSADEAMALLANPVVYQATWWDGRDEALTLTGEATGETVTVVDSACDQIDRIEFDATFHLVSANGSVDETQAQRISWHPPWEWFELAFQVPVDQLGGTFDPASFDPEATTFSGYLRVGGSGGGLGYLGLVAPDQTYQGPNTWFAWWGDVDTDPELDTAAGP